MAKKKIPLGNKEERNKGLSGLLRTDPEPTKEVSTPAPKEEEIEITDIQAEVKKTAIRAKRNKDSKTRGTKIGETRHTFTLKEDQLEQVKRIAYHHNVKTKDIAIKAFEMFLDAYVEKNGPPRPIPKSKDII
jgi:hypothetical protein